VVRDEVCIDIGKKLEVVLTIVRSVGDLFYTIQIFTKFRTAYVAPSSKVFGRGELVLTYSKIAVRYFSKGFWLDFIAALPLPQVLIWIIIPTLRATGVVTETAWAGAAYNLMLYMLASHELAGTFYQLNVKKHVGEVYAIWRNQIVNMDSLIATGLKMLSGSNGL
ncbi:cyclic nucleotide-gated ion channel 15-like protein, partial [Trifolium pratense]